MQKNSVLLFDFNPSLRDEWDYSKNTLNPEIMAAKSGKKAWWLCDKGHSSYAAIQSRAIGKRCNVCRGMVVSVGVNDLQTLRPDLAAELIDKFLATLLMPNSNKRVEWKCSFGHHWFAYVSNRNRGNGCPYCAGSKVLSGFNDLATTHPNIAEQMCDKNILPTEIGFGSNKKVQWKCSEGHQWMASITKRVSGRNCPYCCNNKILVGHNNIWATNPDIAKELVNPEDGYTVSAGSEKMLEWVCSLGHQWKDHPGNRINPKRRYGCPYCSGKKALIGFNDLATTHPHLVSEWDEVGLSPTEVTFGSGRKVQWKCVNGHTWKSIICNRSKGSGCAQCSQAQTSKIEGRLRILLAQKFDNVGNSHLGRVPVKDYVRKTRSVDIEWLDTSGKHIVVEYDGSFWHLNKFAYDTQKTKNLLDNGYIIIRIREQSRLYALDLLDIQHPNLLQVKVDYDVLDTNLIKAVDEIEKWIVQRRVDNWLAV